MKALQVNVPKCVLLILGFSTSWASDPNDESFGKWIIHHVSNSTTWKLPFVNIDLTHYHFKIIGLEVEFTLHSVMIIIASLIAAIVLPLSAKRKNMLPTSSFGHAIEALVLFIREEIAIPFLGRKHTKEWLPFILTLFFFILSLNIMGLIPYFSAPTGNINVTAALAIMVLVIFLSAGITQNGLSYFKNLVPPGIPAPVLIILYPIEIASLLTKSAALAIRMFANLSAGHFVIFSLLGMISVFHGLFNSTIKTYGAVVPVSIAFAVFMWSIEILVAFLQAYVFTMLTTLFIGSAIHQEH
jgi:F-type H+-transporting ATPase subunit a